MVFNRLPLFSKLLIFLGVMVIESESRQPAGASFLDLKFCWQGQASTAARGIVYGMEFPNIEYAVGRGPKNKGIGVVRLSPFPYRFPQKMHAKDLNAYLDPPISIDAGILKISISWSTSPTAMRDWMEKGLHPTKWGDGESSEIAKKMESWEEKLGEAPPEKTPISIQRATRDIQDSGVKMDTVLLGKSVLEKGSFAEFEIALPPMVTDEEQVILVFPDFSISIERPKSRLPLAWLAGKSQHPDSVDANPEPEVTIFSKEQSTGKSSFWKFWKWGE
jgi:hypothetical protein